MTNSEQTPMLDLLASKEEQLRVLVPYLENAAKNEERKPLDVTGVSSVLANRVLAGWKEYVVPKKAAITEEGAFLYYLKLKGQNDD